VKCSRVKFKWEEVKRSEGLRNRSSIMLEDHKKFAAYMVVSFNTFFHILLVLFCITVYKVVYFVCFYLIL